jgi:hypothetical protein
MRADALKQQPPANLQLIEDQLARLDGSTSAIVLAAALDREMSSVENIGGKYKLVAEVAVQALFFDFREKQVIASYPVTLQYIDSFNAKPTDAQIDAVFEHMLYGNGAANLPQEFARTLTNARLSNAAARRLQVVGVEFADDARAMLPAPELESGWRNMLASEFTKILSAETGIGMLPPASGQAIGGAMAARFADGRVYQLKIPDADYQVKLHIDRFATRTLEETAAVKVLLFGTVFGVSVIEPLSGKVYFDQPLRKASTKTMPASQTEVEAAPAYYETLLAGLVAFSDAAAGRVDGKWLDAQQPGGKLLNQQIKSLQELIASCH